MLAMLEELVSRDTPASSKTALDELVDEMAEVLSSAAAVAEVIPRSKVGNVLRATWAGGPGGQILVLGHLDTVWPMGEVERRQFRTQNGFAYGPGVLDMKAGVVQLVFALRGVPALGVEPSKRVVCLLTCDEEIGSPESREIIEAEARRSQAVFVLEPATPDGALKTSRKGWGLYHLTATGRAAHAGANPELGVSAIEELAHQVTGLHALTDFELGTTINVGVISGGTRPNVIAERAEAEVDLRVKTLAEAERIRPLLENRVPHLPGARVKVAGGLNRPPMERTSGNVALFRRAVLAAQGLGFTLGEASSGAASDGNFSTALGIPTLDGLGAVGSGPHAVYEHIEISSIPQRASLLACLLTDPGLPA